VPPNDVIELVYFDGCPHVDHARAVLRDALEGEATPEWIEWNVDHDDVPPRLARLPSPTVLVNGEPVGETARLSEGARACRSGGVITPGQIRAALGL
jgi:hypothetical protein